MGPESVPSKLPGDGHAAGSWTILVMAKVRGLLSLSRHQMSAAEKTSVMGSIIFFNVYLLLRERERESTSEHELGRGRERETQNPKQVPGSELSAQSDAGL